MPSVQSRVIAGAATLTRMRDRQFDPSRFPATATADPKRYAPPKRLRRRTSIDRTTVEGWPVYTLTPRASSDGRVLFLHGGAYAAEIQAGHWSFAAALAERTGRTVTVPIYPLAPAATHRDVQPVLRRLYADVATTDRMAVMGDSAGGALSLSLVANLPPGVPRPRDLVLLSPLLDLTLTNPQIETIASRDPLLRVDHVRELCRLYAGADGPEHPEVNPINGPLDHLGTVTVFTGTRDLLNPDAHRFQDLAATAPGTTVVLHEFTDMIHDWMLMPMPEAKAVMSTLTELLA